MPLERFRYRVSLREGGQLEELEVEVTHGDLLRAELEADKQHLPVDPRRAPQQTTTLWVWAALVRTKRLDVDYRTFRDGFDGSDPILEGMEQIKGPTGEPAVVTVDPTGAGTGSRSVSPVDSVDSQSGSTPTSTNG
jgi:hypothetical protein